MRKIHFLLIIIMTLAACGKQEGAPAAGAPPASGSAPVSVEVAPQTPAQDERFTIVMLGDSLTAGFGLATDEALPEELARILARNGFNLDVINAGVSGDTTAGGLARYDWSVASAKPDLLIVALGANDFLQRIPAEQARKNLSAIIERAQGDGVGVVLASVEAGGNEDEDPRIDAYAAIYPELAAKYDVPLFEDILRGVSGEFTLMQLDGLHPTREGVKIIATRMAKFVGPYLPEDEE